MTVRWVRWLLLSKIHDSLHGVCNQRVTVTVSCCDEGVQGDALDVIFVVVEVSGRLRYQPVFLHRIFACKTKQPDNYYQTVKYNNKVKSNITKMKLESK